MDNFTYLKSFLTGKASRAAKGLAVTTENYEESLQALNERYGKVQITVNSHFEELTKSPGIQEYISYRKVKKIV